MSIVKKTILKISAFIVSLLFLISVIQPLFIPKYHGEATTMVDGIKRVNDIDVLFLGGSQMFCAVDSKTLTEKYNIASYNLGASNQCLTITKYYLDEALKYCKPKIVYVELGNLYYPNSDVDDVTLAWNYSPTKVGISKYNSLLEVTGDPVKSAKYTFFPLIIYHSRWNELYGYDLRYFLEYFNEDTYSKRGFTERDEIVPTKFQYNINSDISGDIPQENKLAIKSIVDTCKANGIKVVFFKIPVPFWTKKNSIVMNKYMNESHYECVDLFEYFDEFNFDENKDFRDDHHANIYGAKKITDFLGNHLTLNGFEF